MICVRMWSVARVSPQAAGGKLGQSFVHDRDLFGMMSVSSIPASLRESFDKGVHEVGDIRT